MPLPDVSEGDLSHVAHHDELHERYNNSVEIRSGTAAARPAAGAVDAGTLYWATDTSELSRSTGAVWESLEVDLTAHEGAANPHPTYLTQAEADALYEALGAVATHAAAGDPHTGYRLESADHTHQSTGLQAGQLDHGAALTGLADNDHPQYDTACFIFSKSGELAVTTDTGAHRLYLPWNVTLLQIEASVGVAPTGASVIVDVHVSGTTVHTTQSNRATIAASGFVDQADSIEDADHDDGQYITVNIDQIGSTLPGENLTVVIWYRRR